MELTPTDASPLASWIAARKKEGTTAAEVIDALGLHLIQAGDESEDKRWVLAALAVTQFNSFTKPRKSIAEVGTSPRRVVELIQRSRNILVVSGSGVSPSIVG